jgi:membrane-bound metal-dependent hydrolase YbcI (DUF457 family)
MASHRGHISIAVVFGGGLVWGLASTSAAAALPLPQRVLTGAGMIATGVLFALFPDVDIKSRGQLLFYRLFIAADVLLIASGSYALAAYFGLLALVPIISRHRGWTHSVVAMLLVPLPILAIPMYLARSAALDGLPFYLAAVTGYLSHLLADGMVFRRR